MRPCFFVVLLVVASMGSSPGAALTVGDGDFLRVHYRIRHATTKAPLPSDLMLFDDGPVSLVVGMNATVPAVDDCAKRVRALDIEETFEVDIFGAPDPRLGPVNVPLAMAPDGLAPGDVVRLVNGATARVKAITADAVVIDANHPLAGEPLELAMTVLAVDDKERLKTAVFAGGCFWGLELAYQREPGVVATKVGYTQGGLDYPSYQAVCSGTTGHTEAVEVTFDPDLVEYDRLCDLLFDRLGENRYALNRVGNDQGTQYRHGIYFEGQAQELAATAALDRAQAVDLSRSVVTEVKPATVFWDAEDYHQHYLQKGGQSARKGATQTIRCYG